MERFRKIERVRIPDDLDYSLVSGLSHEIQEKLGRMKPLSLGQASRISGVTPAAIAALEIHLKARGMIPREGTAAGFR